MLEWEQGVSIVCGGTIYTPQTIITAANCCAALEEIIENGSVTLNDNEIRGGELVLSETSGVEQTKKIRDYLIHPNYNTNHYDGVGSDDICLLFLESELEFNDQVKSISLNTDATTSGMECVVSGWGIYVSIWNNNLTRFY